MKQQSSNISRWYSQRASNMNHLKYLMCHTKQVHSTSSTHDSHALTLIRSFGFVEGHDYKFRTYHHRDKQLLQLRECPLCPPHKNNITNLWTLGIFTENGSFNCFRCGNHGNWNNLLYIFQHHGYHCGDAWNEYHRHDDEMQPEGESEESEIEQITVNSFISEQEIQHQNNLLFQETPLLNRLWAERNLSPRCFKDYKCGLQYGYFSPFKQKQQCLTFPMYQYRERRFVATKYKTRCVSNNIKSFNQYPVMNEPGLFGFGSSEHSKRKCVVTEGEYDAMAVYEGTGYEVKAVSLPIGANTISDKLIDQLSAVYDEFLLFLDWDAVGQQNAERLKERLKADHSKNEVEIARKQDNESLFDENTDIKDANDILISYKDKGYAKMRALMSQYKVI